MSISKPRSGEERPTKKYIEFKSGTFRYYDKEKEENVDVKLPIEFVVIDELATVKGWSDKFQCGIYSNEVHSTLTEQLIVNAFKGGGIATGIYGEIKDKIKSEGGRYCKSVYAVMGDELVNFQLVGAALSAWIEKEVNFTRPKFTVKSLAEGKKGATVYKIPVFEISEATQEEWDVATKIDKEILQPYFDRTEKKEDDIKVCTADDIQPAREVEEKEEPEEEEVKVDDLPF